MTAKAAIDGIPQALRGGRRYLGLSRRKNREVTLYLFLLQVNSHCCIKRLARIAFIFDICQYFPVAMSGI